MKSILGDDIIVNELKLEGRILKVTYRNAKVINFIIGYESEFSHKKINLTCFNPELFETIVDNINKVVLFKGAFMPNNYKDKNTNKWINSYTVSVESIDV